MSHLPSDLKTSIPANFPSKYTVQLSVLNSLLILTRTTSIEPGKKRRKGERNGESLSLRTQRVCYNGSLSNISNVTCGVPQGSCLGPILFSIFTNDLSSAVKKSVSMVMYVDDSIRCYAHV